MSLMYLKKYQAGNILAYFADAFIFGPAFQFLSLSLLFHLTTEAGIL